MTSGSFKRTNPFVHDLKLNLKTILGITLGLFLFLIFFLPLNPPLTDFSKKLLVLSGFPGIVLALLLLLRIGIPSLFPKYFYAEKGNTKKDIVFHLIFLVLNSVAYSFFARYVALIDVTFNLVVRIALISLIPVAAMVIVYEFQYLKKQLSIVLSQNPETELIPGENDSGIEFDSENGTERFFLFPEQIIVVKAANNYIEIIYKQNDKVSRRLIRNTLKKAEVKLSGFPFLLRCHRSYIVNKNCIRNMEKTADGLKLTLYDYTQEINVSRQYILHVREAMKDRE